MPTSTGRKKITTSRGRTFGSGLAPSPLAWSLRGWASRLSGRLLLLAPLIQVAALMGFDQDLDGTWFHAGIAALALPTALVAYRRDLGSRMSPPRGEAAGTDGRDGRSNALSDVVAGIVHELNQPLSATVNFIAAGDMLLKSDASPARIGEMLDMASRQALRTGEIVQHMRSFVFGHDGEMCIEPVAPLVREGIALALTGESSGTVAIACDLDPAARLVRADRVLVQQVLVNLVRNGVEALQAVPPDQRRMVIAARVSGRDMVEISVRDTGPGIPDRVVSQLGTPFTTKGSAGMGIGLSICRHIIEMHGGGLLAENVAGGGACFRFTLPLVGERDVRA